MENYMNKDQPERSLISIGKSTGWVSGSRTPTSSKVRDDVFDEITLLALYRLVHKKWLSAIGGSISTGKEANVFLADREGTDIAIKIVPGSDGEIFNTMNEYILGDRRFTGIEKIAEGPDFCLGEKRIFKFETCARGGSFRT